MKRLRRFLAWRPFSHFTTRALHLFLVGNAIQVSVGWVSLLRGGLPIDIISWCLFLLNVVVLVAFGLLVLLQVLDYRARHDRPARFWHITLTLPHD